TGSAVLSDADSAARADAKVDRDLMDRLTGRLELGAALDGYRLLIELLTEQAPVQTSAGPGSAALSGPPGPSAFSALSALSTKSAPPRRTPARIPWGTARTASPDERPRVRFASYSRASLSTAQASTGSSCGPDPFQLLDMPDAPSLNDYMNKQHEADRFVRGSKGEAGGSAPGRLFTDLGTAIGMASVLGPNGKAVAEVWGAFSALVLGTTEGYQHLLPGQLVLAVSATPNTFEEDHPGPGTWQASARAESMPMNLTEEVLQQVLQQGMKGASVGKELTRRADA